MKRQQKKSEFAILREEIRSTAVRTQKGFNARFDGLHEEMKQNQKKMFGFLVPIREDIKGMKEDIKAIKSDVHIRLPKIACRGILRSVMPQRGPIV